MKNIKFKKVLLALGAGLGLASQAAYAGFDYETCYILHQGCLDGFQHACDLYYSKC